MAACSNAAAPATAAGNHCILSIVQLAAAQTPLAATAAATAAWCVMQGVDTTNDALLYQCKTLASTVTSEQLAATQTGTAAAANVSASSIDAAAFAFTSRPGAPYKLWLDFVGSVITGSGGPATHLPPACGLGACPVTLSLAQQRAVSPPFSTHFLLQDATTS